MWYLFLRIITYSYPYYKSFVISVLMMCLASIFEALGPVIISCFINSVILYKDNCSVDYIIILVFFYLVLQIIVAILRYFQSLKFNCASLEVIKKLRIDIMRSILRKSLSVLHTQSIGKLVSVIIYDTEVIKDFYLMVIFTVLRSLILIFFVLAAMIFLDWKLACVSLMLFPIVFIVIVFYYYYSMPIFFKIRTYLTDISNKFNEVINGMVVIQQFRQQKKFENILKKINCDHFNERMKVLRLEGYLLRPLLNLLFSFVLCGILLIFSFQNISSGIEIGVLYAFINYLGRLNEPLIELTSQQSIFQQAMVSSRRIFEIIDLPNQFYGLDNFFLEFGSIEFRNLTFSYGGERKVLSNISLFIPPKSFVALVGRTGSGKSTLANLIMGYYSIYRGHLLLDGKSINSFTYHVLRYSVLMVQQDPVLLPDTVFANISLGRSVTEQEVWDVLRKVKLYDLVKKMPQGIFTKLSKDVLSIGQKQLLGLARVLILVPVILIFDEVTANIDSSVEYIIKGIIRSLRGKVTIIVIAHRFSTILDADKIVVLHKGEIIESGTHDFLLNNKGRYYHLYKLQNI